MLEYRVLGGLRVVDDGDEVNVGGPRQRRLLSMLLVHRNTVVSVDRLAEAVFVGEPTEGAATTLRSYVARVRRAIAREGSASRIVTRAPGYMLELSGDAFDVARLEGLVAEGRSRLAHGDPGAAAGALHDGLVLWRGEAYAEFSDEDWVRPEAERLGELHLAASELFVDAELACGRAADVVPQLETLVAEQPLHEALLTKLAVALYRSGRQVEALRVMHDHRTLLADEVGLEPSPELDALEQRILAHDPALQLEESAGLPLRGYRLGKRLGTGTEGTVYAGWLPGVERDLAIRVVREEIADRPEFVRSFETTAQRVASLRSEAVVPIHDWWREPGGAYLVMRRMPGGTLRDRLERGPMPSGDVAAVATRIGGALETAAEQDIVHGRLRPESVLFDDAGTPYLSDFGLGSAACNGDDDVHGFSALVAECLTGRPPSDGKVEGLPSAVTAVLARGLATSNPPPVAELVPALVAALTGEAEAPAQRPNPYKGLRAFDESDAGDFFGRDDLVDELVARLACDDLAGRLLLVVGGSGSGKSSAVRAGLVPRVRRGGVAGSEGWFVTAMVPGTAPFDQLARSLRHVAVAEAEAERLADELRSGVGGIDAVLRRLVPDGGQLLLLIDQFEELFTGAGEAEQQAFLDGLTDAVTIADSRLRVVATLRADFYDRPLGFHRFGALVRDATVTVASMSAAELEAAIVGPATRVGGSVETALVAELVAAVIDEPAALPSLQYTLYDLADASSDGALTLAAYRELGGVDAAIAARAEALFRSLDGADRSLVRLVFERLVTVGIEGEPTRRRARRSELAALAPGPSVDRTVEAWAQARLLTVDRDPDSREPTVEVAHEALLRDWPRLRGWIAEHRDAIAVLGQVRDATASWLELDRDPGALYRGARLDVALDVTDRLPEAVPEAERDFLDASRTERERARQREAERVEHQARVNRRLRTQLAIIGVALVVALVVGVVAVGQRERANDGANLAATRELAAAATANLEDDPERGILLALEAVEQARSGDGSALPEAEEALHRTVATSRVVMSVPGQGGALGWSPDGAVFVTEGPEDTGLVDVRDAGTGESVRSFHGHDKDVNDVAFNSDGSLLATTGDDGAARLWDPATGEERWSFESSPDIGVWGPSFSPDGSLFAASWPDAVRIMDLRTGRTIRRIDAVPGPVRTAFSPDGERIAISTESAPIAVVVDVNSGEEAFSLEGHTHTTRDVAWSPDGRWIATSSDDASARIWNARTGDLRFALLAHETTIQDIAWSPDSTRLLTGSSDGTAKLWGVTEGGPRELLSLSAQDTRSGVKGVAFSPDGDRVMTSDEHITAVKVWDVAIAGDAEVANLPAVRLFMGSTAFAPDGRLLATGPDGSVAAWDTDSRRSLLTFGPDGSSAGSAGSVADGSLIDSPSGIDVLDIEVNSDGRLVATASADGLARVWDAETGHEAFTVDGATPVTDVAWSPNGDLLAAASLDGDTGLVTIVDRSGDEVAALREEPGVNVGSVSFSADNRLLATSRMSAGRADPNIRGVKIWDWDRGEVVRTIDAGAARAVFAPSGDRIAATISLPAGDAGTVEVWDTATGRRTAVLAGHTGGALDVAFAPDGATVATSGADGTVRLWDAESGAPTLVLDGHRGLVTSVAFSPDGSRLASASGDGTVRVWALDLDDLIEIAKDEVTRTLTNEECQRYLHQARCD